MVTPEALLIIAIISLCIARCVSFVKRRAERFAELGRLEARCTGVQNGWYADLPRFVRALPGGHLITQERMLLSQAERILLQDLGDGGEGDVLRYLALRTAWMACVLAVSMYAVMAVSFGAIIPVLCGAVLLALWGPRSVLDLAWEVRRRELMVEKPIVFAMLGAGARATREVVGVLGNSADILCGKLNTSTLAYGVLRARWRARIVGSWYCALNADRQDAAVGPIVADALSQLGTVIQHDCGDVGHRLQVLTKQAQEQLAVDLQRHRRLIVFKVGVLIVASLVGVALISSYSLQNFWGG